MKKMVVIAFVLGLVLSGMVFADGDYTVHSLKGDVQREVSPNKWETVSVGQKLAPSARIKTGIGASLVLKEGSRTITVSALKNNTVEKLAVETGSAVRIGGKASDTSGAVATRATSGVSTASTRASDAAADVEWSEE